MVALLNRTAQSELPRVIGDLLTRAAIHERWALVKLATGALRYRGIGPAGQDRTGGDERL